MAFNSSTNKVAKKGLVKIVESTVSGRFVLDNDDVIDKVHSGLGRVNISEERIGDNVQVSGAVNFSVLYTLVDKNLGIGQVAMNFSERIDVLGLENVACLSQIKSYKFIDGMLQSFFICNK